MTWTIIGIVVALALAVQSVRVLVALPSSERGGRVIVLSVAALLGAGLALALGSLIFGGLIWEAGFLGAVAGIAVVELGPGIYLVAGAWFKRKGDGL